MAKEKETECCAPKKWHHHGSDSGGAIYFFGMVGTAVYFVQQVSGFWPTVLALLKSIVWPAFLLHKVFSMLNM